MAEGILKKIALEKSLNIQASSAGIFADIGSPANENTVLSMRDIGIDIGNHMARLASEDLIEENDLILTMTMSHKEFLLETYPQKKHKIFSLNEYAFTSESDIEDPYGGSKIVYDKSRDEILSAIEKAYKHI